MSKSATYRQRTRPTRSPDPVESPPAHLPDEHDGSPDGQPSDPSLPPPNAAFGPAEGAYTVGYKKPPLQSRFKKGVCPNPKGRPKGAKDMRLRILELANEKVPVRENGRVKRMTKLDVGTKKALNKFAETGDLKAIDFLLKIGNSLAANDRSGPISTGPAEQEKPNPDLLQWFLESHRAKPGTDGEGT